MWTCVSKDSRPHCLTPESSYPDHPRVRDQSLKCPLEQ